MNLLNFQSSKTLRESEGRTNRISFKIRKCNYSSGWCFHFRTKPATTDSLGAPRGGRAPIPARAVPCAFAGCDCPFQGTCVSGTHGRVRGQTQWHCAAQDHGATSSNRDFATRRLQFVILSQPDAQPHLWSSCAAREGTAGGCRSTMDTGKAKLTGNVFCL